MSEESNQMLSALVDGELPSAEAGSVVNLTHLDLELKAKWGRYHLIGEALRGGLPTHLRRDLAARVSAAVAAEPAIIAAPPAPVRGAPRLLRPAAGLAIAASVALLAVVAVQRVAVTPATPGTPQQLAAAPASEPTVTPGMALQPVDWSRNQAPEAAAAARSKMNDYLLNYSERRANWGAPGMLPYVKVVGYENDQ